MEYVEVKTKRRYQFTIIIIVTTIHTFFSDYWMKPVINDMGRLEKFTGNKLHIELFWAFSQENRTGTENGLILDTRMKLTLMKTICLGYRLLAQVTGNRYSIARFSLKKEPEEKIKTLQIAYINNHYTESLSVIETCPPFFHFWFNHNGWL